MGAYYQTSKAKGGGRRLNSSKLIAKPHDEEPANFLHH